MRTMSAWGGRRCTRSSDLLFVSRVRNDITCPPHPSDLCLSGTSSRPHGARVSSRLASTTGEITISGGSPNPEPSPSSSSRREAEPRSGWGTHNNRVAKRPPPYPPENGRDKEVPHDPEEAF